MQFLCRKLRLPGLHRHEQSPSLQQLHHQHKSLSFTGRHLPSASLILPAPYNSRPPKMALDTFFHNKIESMKLEIIQRQAVLRRLEAQRNDYNSRVRLLREELGLLQQPGSYVGEVVKVMSTKKVLVKVHPEGKYGMLTQARHHAIRPADSFRQSSMSPTISTCPSSPPASVSPSSPIHTSSRPCFPHPSTPSFRS
jgi:hypothetical protein